MRHRHQRGMTLVELLVAMAVMSFVLVGVTGALYDVSRYYQGWATRLEDATTGSALAASIQEDSGRYLVCQHIDHAPSLEFCIPGTGTETVAYTVTRSGSTYSVYRQELPGGKVILMARGVPTRPVFSADCFTRTQTGTDMGTASGHVHIYNYRTDDRSPESFSVYYHAPIPSQGSCPS